MQLDFMELDANKKTEYEIRSYSLLKQLKEVVPEDFFRNNVEIHVMLSDEGRVEFKVYSKGQILSFNTNNLKNKVYLYYRLTKCA